LAGYIVAESEAMFVGHLAVALGARRAEPRAPLSALIGAAFGLDLLWPFLLLVGVETVRVEPGNTAFTPLNFVHYPWSHSLSMAVILGVAVGRIAAPILRSARAGLFVGGAVISHWVLDYLTHRPDLPLWPGGPMAGLGLWNSIAATLVVEGAIFVAAIEYYRRGTRARDAQGRWAFWSLIGLTTAIWISGPWLPPPPSTTAIAVVGLATWLFLPWGTWIDRHRTRP
jgi:hypothetical protein